MIVNLFLWRKGTIGMHPDTTANERKIRTELMWLSQRVHFPCMGQTLNFQGVVDAASLTSVNNFFPVMETSYLRNLPRTLSTKSTLAFELTIPLEKEKQVLAPWLVICPCEQEKPTVFISIHIKAREESCYTQSLSKGTQGHWSMKWAFRAWKREEWGLCFLCLPCRYPLCKSSWRKMLVL